MGNSTHWFVQAEAKKKIVLRIARMWCILFNFMERLRFEIHFLLWLQYCNMWETELIDDYWRAVHTYSAKSFYRHTQLGERFET